MSLNYAYDAAKDILTIEDIQYSGELFRQLGTNGLETGRWFQIERRDDGILTIYSAAPGARLAEPTSESQ